MRRPGGNPRFRCACTPRKDRIEAGSDVSTAKRLSRIADLIAAQHDVEDVLRAAVAASRGLMGSDAAFAALPRPDGAFGMDITEGMRGARMGSLVLSPGVGLAALVTQEGRSVLVEDYVADARFFKPPDLLDVVIGDEALETVACVPVWASDDTPLALLYVGVRGTHRLSDAALQAVETIAGYASLRTRLIAAEARDRELAALRERQRLATELHDSVAQSLFAIGVEVRRLHGESGLPESVTNALVGIDRIVGQAGEKLRDTLHTAARIPDDVALEIAIEKETRGFEESTGCGVIVTYSGGVPCLPGLAEQLILDTVREGLCNVAKHARAASVLVHLRSNPDQVAVFVQDDGSPPATQSDGGRPAAGTGIALLRHKARALGGSVAFERSDEGDHRLTLVLPRRSGR